MCSEVGEEVNDASAGWGWSRQARLPALEDGGGEDWEVVRCLGRRLAVTSPLANTGLSYTQCATYQTRAYQPRLSLFTLPNMRGLHCIRHA
jgi:hypothetical protein